ncbi:MAG: twin-arginine translocase TatA/TatE family subunit [Thermomicrobiales bacterium]
MGFGALQPMHLLLILAIVLVVFGAGKLGQIGGALGKSVKEFKENVGDDEEQNQLTAAQEARPIKTEAIRTETRAAAPVATVERPTETLRREEI